MMNGGKTILTFAVALNCEARPIIDLYRLKKQPMSPFDYYMNEPGSVALIVTGIGSLAMATGVGWVAAQGSSRVWLNVGTAGHADRAVGDIIRVHGVASGENQRAHYPPQVAHWSGDTEAILSVTSPGSEYPGGAAVDMEAFAFFEAATKFSASELVQSLKVISDNQHEGIECLNAQKMTKLIESQMSSIEAFAKSLSQLSVVLDLSGEFDFLLETEASFSQRQQLKSLLQKVTVLALRDEVTALQLESSTPIKTVLRSLRQTVDKAKPQIGGDVRG